MIVISVLWGSTLGVFASNEDFAHAVLPIIFSLKHLKVLMACTVVAWLIFAELLYVLQGPQASRGSHLHLKHLSDTFYFLFIADAEVINPYQGSEITSPEHMRDSPIGASPILIFLMVAVFIFTVWILNIYFSVMIYIFLTQVR